MFALLDSAVVRPACPWLACCCCTVHLLRLSRWAKENEAALDKIGVLTRTRTILKNPILCHKFFNISQIA